MLRHAVGGAYGEELAAEGGLEEEVEVLFVLRGRREA
jgi:hypothetical protein